ncbi:MAG: GGDEF domain-containing phosphodiesterase [Spirochaetes bacterium]|nr:GGDEF domain-containing phosphodiesterase [Spirochaetota bacterium]
MSDTHDHKSRLGFLEKEIDLLRVQNQRLSELLSEQERRHRDLEERLSVDARSGLPNHLRLSHELDADLSAARNGTERIAVVILKLDSRMTLMTKTMKPTVIEWILYQTGQRLLEAIGPGDSLYHARDDEFVLVYRSVSDANALRTRIAAAVDVVGKPHVFSGYHLAIGCVAGAAIFPDHGLDRSRLLHNADIALEYARSKGRSVKFFSERIRESVVEKMELQNAILKALESQAIKEISRQFLVFFQPIVTLGEIGKDSVRIERVDAEVLIRWDHPTRGLLGPNLFIPTAEETGLIIPIGNWVLYRTAEILREWSSGALGEVRLSVNISPRQFASDHLFENVKRVMQREGRERLKFEITESCLMDDPMLAVARMGRLKSEGVSFSVDDFGTGYSSLSYLSKLPVSSLKIDQSFVRHIEKSKQDRTIVRTILSLGREMNFDVVCEGVENEQQIRILSEDGCSCIQGYIFGRPMPAQEFRLVCEEFLRKPVSFDRLKALSMANMV